MVWLEVRILPAPPRTPIRTECSGDSSISPPIGGSRGGHLVSRTGAWFWLAFFAPIVSGVRKLVPGAGIALDAIRARLTDETEHRCLAGPLDWRIAQAGDADTEWQSTFDSGLHKSRCKESKRNYHQWHADHENKRVATTATHCASDLHPRQTKPRAANRCYPG